MQTQNRFFDDLARAAGAGLNLAMKAGERLKEYAPTKACDADLKTEIETLKAKVDALERRLQDVTKTQD